MASNPDPSLSSYYVGEDFYQSVIEVFTDWQTDDAEIRDPAVRDQCRMVLEREARLLDQGRHRDWLDMYAAECLYWVPASPGGGDPRREVAVSFDDRRRLEDRIFRLGSEYAWSQMPRARTSRIVSNVAVFRTADADIVMYGHTHQQLQARIADVLIINPGSGGEGRDHRNGRKLSCAVLDMPSEEVKLIDFANPLLG